MRRRRADARLAEALRPALPRARLGRQGGARDRAAAPPTSFSRSARAAARMTRPLAAAAAHVVAFEIDRDLAADAARRRPRANVTVVEGDFLDVDAGTDSATRCARPAFAPVHRSAWPATCPTTSRRRSCSSCIELYRRGRAARRRDGDAAARGRRPAARAARARKDYGVLSVLIRHARRRRAAAGAAARRVSAAAEGAARRSSGCGSTRPTRRPRRAPTSSRR